MSPRATRRKAKPGEVLLIHGRLPGQSPDHIVMWGGSGATKRHANLVLHNFNSPKVWRGLDDPPKSFFEELEAAGFDLTTIEFRIRMKPQQENTP